MPDIVPSSCEDDLCLTSILAVTSSILGSMKGIKITNLTAGVLTLLKKLRHNELAAASKFRFMSVGTATIGKGLNYSDAA